MEVGGKIRVTRVNLYPIDLKKKIPTSKNRHCRSTGNIKEKMLQQVKID